MPTITRRDLAKILAEKMGLKKTLAYQCADALFQAIAESIMRGNRIEIRGFGVWDVRETNPKASARNPKTGEQVFVPARRKVLFKAGRILKQALFQTLEAGGAE